MKKALLTREEILKRLASPKNEAERRSLYRQLKEVNDLNDGGPFKVKTIQPRVHRWDCP